MPCHLTSLTGSRTTDPDRPRAVPSEIQDGTLSAYRRKDSRWRDFCHSLADRKICCMWTSRTSPKRFTLLVALATMMFFQSLTALKASPIASRVSDFTLSNGLRVVVVPDHRAPVVTHYVWYLAGSADDPPGTSGIAHFLEHLMFKSTDKMPRVNSPRSCRASAARTMPSPPMTTPATTSALPRSGSEPSWPWKPIAWQTCSWARRTSRPNAR